MAELATIARPYAEALFRVAQRSHLTAWSDWLQKLAQIACHADMSLLISNPKIRHEQVEECLLSAVESPISHSEPAKNWVRLLVGQHRLGAIPEIIKQFEALKNAYQGVAKAVIVSAFPLDEQSLAELVAALKRRFGRELIAQVSVDPSLIGGVRVTVGDQVLDASVRVQLAQMQTALTIGERRNSNR